MRVLIAQPAIEDFYQTPHRLSALGGFSLKALLEKEGHRVSLVNFPARGKGRVRPLPPYASHLSPYLQEEKGPVSFFTRWNRWGPEPEIAAEEIGRHEPDVLMISLFAWAYGEEAVSLGRAVRRRLPRIVVMAGGAGVTVNPEFFCESNAFDLVLAGEGESLFKAYSLWDLCEAADRDTAPSDGIPGAAPLLRVDGFCQREEMMPALSLVRQGKRHSQAAAVLTRGCPRRCRFCSNHLTQGRERRPLPLSLWDAFFSRWLDDIALPHPMKLTLDFEDDNLLTHRDYLIEAIAICEKRWTERGYPRENLFFTAENGMDYGLLTEAFLDVLIGKGFRQFNFSLASANRDILDREKRFASPEKLGALLGILKERRVPSVTYFICGLEGDSPENTAHTLALLGRLPTLSGISLFYPVPGLPGFSSQEDTARTQPGLCRGSLAFPWTGALTTAQLITAFRLSRLINLMTSSQAGDHGELIGRIKKENALHSYSREGALFPVPHMDGEMTGLFLDYFSRKPFR